MEEGQLGVSYESPDGKEQNMTTTLDRDFLGAVILMSGFRGNAMKACQAALLMIGLRQDFSGADLPGELTNGSKHIAGAACGALLAQGLIEAVGRIKSPHPDAKGRKLNLYRIPSHRTNTARTWLRANGFIVPESAEQLSLLA